MKDAEQNRRDVQSYRDRYGTAYQHGHQRAVRRAARLFRAEHPEVWAALLEEECGRLRAEEVARRHAPARDATIGTG